MTFIDHSGTGKERSPRWESWLLAGILALAVLIRLYHLGSWPLEQDELYTLRDATDLGASSTGPGIAARPVYYLLQHLLLALFPSTPLLLRIPPMLFGVLGVWVTWRLARGLGGVTAAAVAAFLLALSPWHLYASQFARYWTLVFVLAAATYWLLPVAMASDRPRLLALATGLVVLGTLTHPTFLFPLPGVVLALSLERDQAGKWRWRWPSAAAWKWLWGPLALFGVVGLVLLRVTGHEHALHNWEGRGFVASLRLLPGMVQWVSPAIAVAAILSAFWLGTQAHSHSRSTWGRMAVLGVASGTILLVAASTRTDVYADYGMAMLPFIYVSVGVAVAMLVERSGDRSRALGWCLAVVLAAASLPGTVSHMLDGTRFDYRPAYGYVAKSAPSRLVVGWPVIVHEHYAPSAAFRELRADTAWLNGVAKGQGAQGIWLITSVQRTGRILDDGRLGVWMLHHCRPVLLTGRPRFDFRQYDVELNSCTVDGQGFVRPEAERGSDGPNRGSSRPS